MKNTFIVMTICSLLWSGCSEECTPQVDRGTLVIDLTDSNIIKQYKSEADVAIAKLTPEKLMRCQGCQLEVIPIGSTIENQSVSISFPATRILDESLGNYDLEDSNVAKTPFLLKKTEDAMNGFTAIGNDQSQIFYSINYLLQHKTGKCVIYTDLLENYATKISFYKPGYDFETMLGKLMEEYSLDTIALKSKFTGTITIVSPMDKRQDKIMYARSFYKYYFDKIGLNPSQYEFLGSISQSKILNQNQ